MYIEKLNFIPKVPNNLLLTIEEAMDNENTYQGSAPKNIYGSFICNESLYDWIQQYFNYEVIVRYQIIGQDLPLHRDHGIIGTKANYLITSGGENVITQWWDDEHNPSKMLYEEKCDINTWYNLNIEEPHTVLNVKETRYSITVRKK